MSSELTPIVTVYANGSPLKSKSLSYSWTTDSAASLSVEVDNSDRTYTVASALCNPRTYAFVIYFTVETGSDTWTSQEFLLDDSDLVGKTLTLECSDRLSQLQIEDQNMADVVNTAANVAMAEVATANSMTLSGGPTRTVPGPFHRVQDQPLNYILDLAYPTHRIRMGAGSQIDCVAATTNPATVTLVDRDHLEDARFRRSKRIYNKAYVEREEPVTGLIDLFLDEVSGAGIAGANIGPHNLSEPSRAIYFKEAFGVRGSIIGIRVFDEFDVYITTLSGTSRWIQTLVPIHSFDFTYQLDPNANNGTEYTQAWRVHVQGYSLSDNPVPTESYSVTGTEMGGDRPYPEPFSSVNLANETDAQAAADTLAILGAREGNVLNTVTRLLADKIPSPNDSITVTDYWLGLTAADFVVETVQISHNESGGSKINLESVRLEGS